MRTSRVEEVMPERVIACRMNTPYKEIVLALLENNISALSTASSPPCCGSKEWWVWRNTCPASTTTATSTPLPPSESRTRGR